MKAERVMWHKRPTTERAVHSYLLWLFVATNYKLIPVPSE